MEKIIIQEYSQEYQEAVINLILNIQQNEFHIPIKREDQPDLSNIPNFYQTGTGNFWIALCNNQVVGTIALIDIGYQQGALRKMFVKAAYRGKAYNTAGLLLAQLMRWCIEHEMKEIYLGTTDKFLAAHRFYEKNGFVRITKEILPSTFPIMKVDTVFYKISLLKKHLNLFFPQWQGGGKDQSTYHGAVEIKNNYLNKENFCDVEVALDHDEHIQYGIMGYQAIVQQLEECKNLLLREKPATIFTVGGGCDIVIGPISYLNSQNEDIAVLWFDAHGDLNTPESSFSKAFHGMPLRTLLGEGNKEIVRQAFSALKPSQIILLGNRELDDAEIRFIEHMEIKMLKPEEIEADMNCVLTEVKAKGAKKLYIHIDLDVLDPAEFPFVPVPAAGGLTIQTLLRLLNTIKKEFAVIGLSLVEYRPSGKQRIELLEEIINMGISL